MPKLPVSRVVVDLKYIMIHNVNGMTGWRADLAAATFGAIGAAALPPVHAIPALALAIFGLLSLLGPAPGARRGFRLGWWFGFGHHLFGLYWITEAILVEAARFWWFVPLAVPSLAAFEALFIAAAVALACRARTGWPRGLTLAGAWTLADLARQFVFTGFPWNPWGSVWAIPGPAGDVMLQPAWLIGVHGLTLVTVWLAAAPVLGRRGWLAAATLLLAWGGFGVWRLAAPEPPPHDLRVILVQGNIPQGEKWERARAIRIFAHYLRLTEDAVMAAEAPSVAIWPESASPFLLEADPDARRLIATAARGNIVLAGADRFGPDRRPRNSLAAIGGDGALLGLYDKWHLVPFGEFQPGWVPLPVQVVPGGGFAHGPGPRTLHLPGLPPLGAMICYEAIFPAEMIDTADRPAWLVNVTNDAWFGNSSGPRQHLAAARLRAVEEALPLFRAANTGITAAFDARGRELGRIGMGETGVLVRQLPGAGEPGTFARFGLLIPLFLAMVAFVVGLRQQR